MKTLALQSILSNLTEAHEELARLFARLQFIVFGEVVDESVKEWAETVAQDERTSPLNERALFVSMVRAYWHLNVAWNCRHASEERVRRLFRTLSWKPILSNLNEAAGELDKLHCRLHYQSFGELPDESRCTHA